MLYLERHDLSAARFAAMARGVVANPVVAGILGPQVAKLASGWLPTTYAGSFLALAGLYAVAAVALLFFFRRRRWLR